MPQESIMFRAIREGVEHRYAFVQDATRKQAMVERHMQAIKASWFDTQLSQCIADVKRAATRELGDEVPERLKSWLGNKLEEELRFYFSPFF